MTEKRQEESVDDGAITTTGLDPYWLLKNDPRGFFGAHNVKYINDDNGIAVELTSLRKLEADGLSKHVRVCGVTSNTGNIGHLDSPTLADLTIDLNPDTPCGKRHYVKLMVVDKYGVAVHVKDKKVEFYTPLEDFVEYCAVLAGGIDVEEVDAVRELEDENARLTEELDRAKKALELTDSDRSCTGVERDSLSAELQKVKEENLQLREACYSAARMHGVTDESLTNLTNDLADRYLADRYRAKCRELEARIKELEERNALLEDNLNDVIEDRDAAKGREKKLENALTVRDNVDSWGDDEALVDGDLMRATILFANDMYHLMAKAIKEEPYKSTQNCPDTPKALIKPSTWTGDNATKGTLRELLRYIYSVRDFLSTNGFSISVPHIPDKIAQAICHPGNQVKGAAERGEPCCEVLKPVPRVTKELLRHAIDHAKRMLNKLADAKSRTDWYNKRMRELHFKDAPQPPSRLLAVLNDNEPVKNAVAVFEDIKTFTLKARAFLQYMGYTGTIPAIHPDLRDEFGKEFTLANGVTVPAMEVLSPAQLAMMDNSLKEIAEKGRKSLIMSPDVDNTCQQPCVDSGTDAHAAIAAARMSETEEEARRRFAEKAAAIGSYRLSWDNLPLRPTSPGQLAARAKSLASRKGVYREVVAEVIQTATNAVARKDVEYADCAVFLSTLIELLHIGLKFDRFDTNLEDIAKQMCNAFSARQIEVYDAMSMMHEIYEAIMNKDEEDRERQAREGLDKPVPNHTAPPNNILGALLIMSLLRKRPKKKKRK